MRKLILPIFMVIVAVIAVKLTLAREKATTGPSGRDLSSYVSLYRKSLDQMSDETMTVFDVTSEGGSLVFHQRQRAPVEKVKMERSLALLRPSTVSSYCESFKALLSNGISVQFKHYNPDNSLLAAEVYGPEDCGNPNK